MEPTVLHIALAEYRTAVRNALFWETQGTHGDGKREAARAVETAARRRVLDIATKIKSDS